MSTEYFLNFKTIVHRQKVCKTFMKTNEKLSAQAINQKLTKSKHNSLLIVLFYTT